MTTPRTFEDFFYATYTEQFRQAEVPFGTREVAITAWEARDSEVAQLKSALAAAQERIRKSEADIAAMTAHAKKQGERAKAAEAERDAFADHAGAMRVWIGSQAWKVDEETTREAGLTLVALFDAYRAAQEGA